MKKKELPTEILEVQYEHCNFFIDENFYEDLDDYCEQKDYDIWNIEDLPYDYTENCQYATLEVSIETVDLDSLALLIIDDNDHRLGEDDSFHDEIKKAFKECFDKDLFLSKVPKLYYPNGQKFVLTKQDIENNLKRQ